MIRDFGCGRHRRRLNKRAEIEDFIGIIVLITLIAVFALFSRMGSLSFFTSGSGTAIREAQLNKFEIVSKIFPFITFKNVPIEQLIAVYACYGNETVNYGLGEINITQDLRTTLDYALEEDLWRLEIGNMTTNYSCITSRTKTKGMCRVPSRDVVTSDFVFALPCKGGFERAVLFYEMRSV